MTLTDTSPGIGTLNEHSLHAFLKAHFESDPEKCEIKIGRYVADIFNDDGITEIQTRGFSNLKDKLAVFLKDYKVTVVYPIAKHKRLLWVDPVTGETSAPRLSPKRGRSSDIFYELIYIKKSLLDENLKIKIILLDIDEYRIKNGWSNDGKKGSTRKDRIPLGITDELDIDCAADYKKLIPQELPDIFTSKELMKALHGSKNFVSRAISVFTFTGAIEKVGKRGREYLYRIAP